LTKQTKQIKIIILTGCDWVAGSVLPMDKQTILFALQTQLDRKGPLAKQVPFFYKKSSFDKDL